MIITRRRSCVFLRYRRRPRLPHALKTEFQRVRGHVDSRRVLRLDQRVGITFTGTSTIIRVIYVTHVRNDTTRYSVVMASIAESVGTPRVNLAVPVPRHRPGVANIWHACQRRRRTSYRISMTREKTKIIIMFTQNKKNKCAIYKILVV